MLTHDNLFSSATKENRFQHWLADQSEDVQAKVKDMLEDFEETSLKAKEEWEDEWAVREADLNDELDKTFAEEVKAFNKEIDALKNTVFDLETQLATAKDETKKARIDLNNERLEHLVNLLQTGALHMSWLDQDLVTNLKEVLADKPVLSE